MDATSNPTKPSGEQGLSPWWRRGALAVMAVGFTLLFPLQAGLNVMADHARAARDLERNRPR